MVKEQSVFQTLIDKVKSLSKQEFENHIESGLTVIAKDIRGMNDFKPFKIFDDWRIVATKPASDMLPVTIYLIPTNDRARAIWVKGQKAHALEQGLPEDVADRWVKSLCKQKFVLMDIIRRAVTDLDLRDKYLRYADLNKADQFKLHVELIYLDKYSQERRVIASKLFKELFV